MSTDTDKPITIAVRFFGGSLHGTTERFMTCGAVPSTIMVPVYGKRNERSILKEAPLIGREMFVRDRSLDETLGELAYSWRISEGARRVASEGKRRR